MKVLLVAACSLTLSFGAAVGVNLQKLSMTREGNRHDEYKSSSSSSRNLSSKQNVVRPPFRQPLWCLGLLIIILDACGDFVFIGLAPQSLLAPLGSLSLGWNILLAPIFHTSEKVTQDIVIATALIYVGTITTVLFAADTTPTYNLDMIVSFIQTPLFLCYELVCIIFLIILVKDGKNNNGTSNNRTSSSNKNNNNNNNKNNKTDGFGVLHYCGISGCLGGQCILFAKCTSELVKNALVNHQYNDWTGSIIPDVFIVGMIGTVLTQLNYLNTGLAKYDSLVMVPVYQSFWNAFGITGGLIFFQEYKYMSTKDAFMYGLGIFITLMGVTLLVQQRRGSGAASARSPATSSRIISRHSPSMTNNKNRADRTVHVEHPYPKQRSTSHGKNEQHQDSRKTRHRRATDKQQEHVSRGSMLFV